MAQWLTNLTRNQSLALLSGLRFGVAVSCGVGRRRGSDPALLWLWRRPAATVLIRPLAWEPPYAVRAAQEMAKKRQRKKNAVSIHIVKLHKGIFFKNFLK